MDSSSPQEQQDEEHGGRIDQVSSTNNEYGSGRAVSEARTQTGGDPGKALQVDSGAAQLPHTGM